MKVFVIDGAGQLWGSERALLDLIDSVPGFQFAVCCPPATPLVDELVKRGVEVHSTFIANLHLKSRWRRLQAAFEVMRACAMFRPDIIHINQSGAYRVALPASKLLNIPIVCHVRIFEDADYLARCAPNPKRLKGIIAISHTIEEELRRFDALKSIPVHWIYDAYSSTSIPGSVRKRVPGRIACVGRIAQMKGQALLVRAMAMEPLSSRADCWMIGTGGDDYVASLKAASPPNVKWCGLSNNVVDKLGSCSVLVCPSNREPLGRVIFEAWDAGAVPVVFAGCGGAAEIVRAADGGLIYEEQSPEALATAVAVAITLDPIEASRLIANGRAWLGANCAPDVYGQAMIAVFSKAVT